MPTTRLQVLVVFSSMVKRPPIMLVRKSAASAMFTGTGLTNEFKPTGTFP